MRRLIEKTITTLYNKYCRKEAEGAYLGGLNRDFNKQLNEREEREAVLEVSQFISGHAFPFLINAKLKHYVEILLCKGETEEQREFAVYSINLILQLEEDFKTMASLRDQPKPEFDKHSIL
jgi:hypothetical protein